MVCCYGLVVSTSTRGVFTPCDRVLVSFRFIDAPQLSRLIYRSLRLVAPRLRRIDGSFGYLKLRRLGPLPAKATSHLALLDYFTFIRLRAVDNAHNPRPPGGRRLRRPPWSDSDVESEKEMVDPDPPILSYFVIILCHNSLFPMFSIIFGHSEEDPLLSIFCILRRHPSGIIAVVWDIGAILTLMAVNTPAVVGPVFHWTSNGLVCS